MNTYQAGRRVLLVTHTGREDIADRAAAVAHGLRDAGFDVSVLDKEAAEIGLTGVDIIDAEGVTQNLELVLALGGDGTFLRAAQLARHTGAPLLGINLGQVGFLAEAEVSDTEYVVDRLARGDYSVEERMSVDISIEHEGRRTASTWALNEATVEKGSPARMLEVLIEIDGHRLSRYGCDGVLCATPSGSTAHAMSAGGPVVWPQVEALLLVPMSAHALFSRPLVVAPTSTITITVEPSAPNAVLIADGRRTVDIPPGASVTVRRGQRPVRVVRLDDSPFTDRLVAKLDLPVDGWRGQRGGWS